MFLIVIILLVWGLEKEGCEEKFLVNSKEYGMSEK